MIHAVREFAETSQAAPPALVISPAHKRAGLILSHALSANIPEGWEHCADQWAEDLTPGQFFGIGYAALIVLDPDTRQGVYDLAQYGQAQPREPMPIWGSPMTAARRFARSASPDEHKAYALICYEAMTPKVRAAFRSHIAETP